MPVRDLHKEMGGSREHKKRCRRRHLCRLWSHLQTSEPGGRPVLLTVGGIINFVKKKKSCGLILKTRTLTSSWLSLGEPRLRNLFQDQPSTQLKCRRHNFFLHHPRPICYINQRRSAKMESDDEKREEAEVVEVATGRSFGLVLRLTVIWCNWASALKVAWNNSDGDLLLRLLVLPHEAGVRGQDFVPKSDFILKFKVVKPKTTKLILAAGPGASLAFKLS